MKWRIIGVVCLSAATFLSPTRADSATEPSGNNAAATAHNGSPGQTAVIPELMFEGGTVHALIQKLSAAGREANLPPLNVIVADDMQTHEVPHLELRNVTYADVFEALNLTRTGPAQSRWQLSASGGGERIWVLNSPPRAPVQLDPLTGRPLNSVEPAPTCQVYPLQRYLAKFNVDDITTAVHTAWGMAGLEHGAQLKYHKDTSLLIAVGRPDQLEIISRVLHSLEEGLALSPERKKQPEVFVNGAVKLPGSMRLPPEQDLDILGAIARAGGLTVRADSNKIRFTRPGTIDIPIIEKTITLEDLKKGPKYNLILKPGDLIQVDEKLF